MKTDAGTFEAEYLSIRAKEGRLYDDAVVKQLPFIDDPEWRIRARSARRLLRELKKEQCRSFLEVGCGNGWLTNYLTSNLGVAGTGVDINKTELQQAQRLANRLSSFIYGDIFSDELKAYRSGTIIFAASIQYFPDFKKVIDTFDGTIHIVDSPFYVSAVAARERSEKYFKSMDSKMAQYYFHHEYKSLQRYDHQFVYRPNRLTKWLGNSPFPHIRIRKGPSAS